MSDLPNGWDIVPLKEIAVSIKGKKPKILSGVKTNGTVPYIDIKAFEKGEIRQYADINSSNIAGKEDVLVVWDGARSGLVGIGQEGAIGSTILAIKPFCISTHYLYQFLQTKYEYINTNHRGTGIPHVDPEVFWNIEFPIPPLNEQRRIVAKLEKLLHRVDACKERLGKIPAILKRFRQSFLSAACSGRLTADWRKINSSSSWMDISLIDIAKELKTGPFGSTLHKSDYVRGKVPVVNPMNIVDRKIVPSSDMTINEETRKRLAKYILREGDIVIARRGEMGRCAVVTSKESGWLCGTGSAIIRLKETASPDYLQLVISSPAIRSHLSDASVGTTMENLNQKLFSAMPISLPPLPEQHEIVRRVEALFKKADEIEARYKKAKAFVDRLTQSILAKAFRGELVPQDPNDEPASVLLERIKAERLKLAPKKRENVKMRKI